MVCMDLPHPLPWSCPQPSTAENSLRTEPPGPQGLSTPASEGVVLDMAACLSGPFWCSELPPGCWCELCWSMSWGRDALAPSVKFLPPVPGWRSTPWFTQSTEGHSEVLLVDHPSTPSGCSLCLLLCPEQFFGKCMHDSTRNFYPDSADREAIRQIQNEEYSTTH